MIVALAMVFLFAVFVACGEVYYEKDYPRRAGKFVGIFALLFVCALVVF